jgi:hypothetical protein
MSEPEGPEGTVHSVKPGGDEPSVALVDSSLMARPRFDLLRGGGSTSDDLLVAIGEGLAVLLSALGDDDDNPFGKAMIVAADRLVLECSKVRS